MKELSNKMPVHVSIIMDGNGRWAEIKGKQRIEGHLKGVESVRACTERAVELGIKYLSIFAFSSENWNRPESEVTALMNLMVQAMYDVVPSLMENNVRLRIIGDRTKLSSELLAAIEKTETMSRSNTGLTLIVFLSYSGKWDILQAAGRYAAEHKGDIALTQSPSEEDFSQYLSTAGIPDPDLLIRTSGEKRISNYLLWQCAYTEFYFTDVLWPDFRRANFDSAIQDYSKRERRYGKTGKQINELTAK